MECSPGRRRTAMRWPALCQACQVPRYHLVFEGTVTARIRPVDAPFNEPLAWFRVVWGEAHAVTAVHVYTHASLISDRAWLTSCDSIAAAVRFCDELEPVTPAAPSTDEFDWSLGSIESSTPKT